MTKKTWVEDNEDPKWKRRDRIATIIVQFVVAFVLVFAFKAPRPAQASGLRMLYPGDDSKYDECLHKYSNGPKKKFDRCLVKSLKPDEKKHFACVLRYGSDSTPCIREKWKAQCAKGDEDACSELCHEPED